MIQTSSARLLSDLDPTRTMGHIEWLTTNTPYRISGGGDDSRAVDYLAEQMRRAGLIVEVHEFRAYNSFPGQGALDILAPVARRLACAACGHIASTPPSGVEAELVYTGAGGEADYDGLDVRGKVVMAEVSYAPATPEKARIAAERGAAGMVLINWGPSESEALTMRALKAVWGNPTPATWGRMPQLPAVSIARKTGEELIALCRSGTVRVRLVADCRRFWATLRQPVGVIRGTRWPDEFVLVSGHVDAWEPGVTCNATGNGTMLEMARVLAKPENRPARSVYFTFWNGHEIAEAAGSTWFVDRLWDLVRERCLAYINVDSPGLKGTSRYAFSASPELTAFAKGLAEAVLGEPVTAGELAKTGDQSFFGVGVPAITGRHAFDEATLRATHGATLGWWNHTSADTLDKVDSEALAKELRLNTVWVSELANRPVWPHDPVALIDNLIGRLAPYVPRDHGLQLDAVLAELKRLGADAARLKAAAEGLAGAPDDPSTDSAREAVNRGLMLLSRCLTSPFRSSVSRWDQDTYGVSALQRPIPLLAELDRLGEEADEDLLQPLFTQLLRARNRLSDAVYLAGVITRGILDQLSLERTVLDRTTAGADPGKDQEGRLGQ